MRSVIPALLCSLCRLAQAQTGCPAVQFQGEITIPAASSSTSHTVVTRQPDGSYTAYELSNTSPYPIIRTTKNYAATLDACLPHRGSGPALAPSTANFGNPMGATSQSAAYAVLPTGNYLSVASIPAGIDAVEFDSNMNLVAENIIPVAQISGQAVPTLISLLLIDLNGDGNPDLVGVNTGGGKTTANGSIYVMLGSGGASFQAPQSYAIGEPSVQTVAAGDFNGDHKLDLAVATLGFGTGAGHVSILFGNGDGSFQDEQVRFKFASAYGIAVADLNSDGHADLVFTGATIGNPQQVATVALGNGDGTFSAGTQYPVGGISVGVADVNGDGIPDVVAGGSILFGDGKGNFPTRRDYASGSAMLFDFDADGIADMVNAPGNPFIFSGPAYVEFGQGHAKFTGEPAALADFSGDGNAIATADFNNDGKPDIVFADPSGAISVLEGSGDGTLTLIYQSNTETNFGVLPTAIAVGDFNKDGNADFVTVDNGAGFGGPQAYLTVYLGDGKGNFTATNEMVAGRTALGLTAADFNGDGILDLAFTAGTGLGPDGGITILLGDGQGNFNVKSGYVTGPYSTAIVAGDFNGDGKADLAVTNRPGTGFTQPGNVSIFLGTGDGTFTAGSVITIAAGTQTGPYSIVTADFNGDKKLDLAITLIDSSNQATGLAVLAGNGDGTFQAPSSYAATQTGLAVADLNGDGIPDLIVSPATAGQMGIGYFLGNGNGSFQQQAAIPTDPLSQNQTGAVIAVDLNHDGKIDLANASAPLGIAVLLNISQVPPPFTVVSAGTFIAGPAAPNSIVTALGNNLTTGTASAQTLPLPLTLANTSVTVAGVAAPLLYVSPTQINFEIPNGLPGGVIVPAITANVVITAPNGSTLTAPLSIEPIAPSIFMQPSTKLPAANLISITSGAQMVTTVSAAPVSLAPNAVYLILYGTGIRGAGSDVSVTIQGTDAHVTYSGPQPDFPGLDQINVLLPKSLTGSGLVNIVLTASGLESNTVTLTIQ